MMSADEVRKAVYPAIMRSYIKMEESIFKTTQREAVARNNVHMDVV